MVAVILGVATNFAIAWALAAWMPLAMYPRQVIRYFVAGGRPWGAAERSARGVHNIWWDELDVDSYMRSAWWNSNDAEDLPGSAEGWVVYARNRHGTTGDVSVPSEGPPRWGTSAGDARRRRPWARGPITRSAGPCRPCGTRSSARSRGTRPPPTRCTAASCSPGRTLDIRGYDFRALPLRPVWSGVLMNSALCAALWWFLLAGPPALRRVLRTRAGRCPKCGYSLHGLAAGSPCPECGGAPGAQRAEPGPMGLTQPTATGDQRLSSQSSIVRPGTRENSTRLWVTSVMPCASAIAAISTS